MPLNPSVRLAYPLIGSAASGLGVISTRAAPARSAADADAASSSVAAKMRGSMTDAVYRSARVLRPAGIPARWQRRIRLGGNIERATTAGSAADPDAASRAWR